MGRRTATLAIIMLLSIISMALAPLSGSAATMQVICGAEGAQTINDSREIRAVALYDKIPYFTTAAGSIAAVAAIKSRGEGEVGVRSLQA